MPFGTFHNWFVGITNMDERSLFKLEPLYVKHHAARQSFWAC